MAKRDERDERDERVAIPLDPEEALRALLRVEPDSEPVSPDQWCPETWMGKRCILRAGHLETHQYGL